MALERQQRISAIDSSPDPLKLYLTTFPSFRLNRKNIINVSLKYSATPLTYAHFQVFFKDLFTFILCSLVFRLDVCLCNGARSPGTGV